MLDQYILLFGFRYNCQAPAFVFKVSLSVVIVCCTVDCCVDVINISPSTLTQTKPGTLLILLIHQQ